MKRHARLVFGIGLVAALAVTNACGGDDDTSSANDDTSSANDDTEPNDTEPNDTEPNDTEPNDTEPNDTEPNDTEPNDSAGEVKTVRIGANMEMTGLIGPSGSQRGRGLVAANEILTEAGGFEVNGERYVFEIELLDNASTAERSISNAQELFGDGINFHFGPQSTLDFVPVWESLQGEEVMFITTATGASPYMEEGDLPLLRTTPEEGGPEGRTTRALKTVLEDVQPTTAAVLGNDNDIGHVYHEIYVEGLEAAGVEIVYNTFIPPDQRDYSAYISEVQNAAPDLVVLGLTNTQVQPFLNQAVLASVTAPAYHGQAGATEAALEGVDTANIRFSFPLQGINLEGRSDPAVLKFKEVFEAEFGEPPDSDGLGFYDSLFMLAEAMSEAGTVEDPRAVARVLKAGGGTDYEQRIIDLVFGEIGIGSFTSEVGFFENGEWTYRPLAD